MPAKRPALPTSQDSAVAQLLQEQHPLVICKLPGNQFVIIDSARKMRGIERNGVRAGRLISADQCRHLPAEYVMHREADRSRFRQVVSDGRDRIERIRKILYERIRI